MMGRQCQLIVTDDDLGSLEALLRSRGDTSFLSSSANEARNALLPLRSLRVGGDAKALSRICYLAPSEWIPKVEVVSLSDVKIDVRIQESEVIEFWRSYCAEGQIQGGRLYYTPQYWNGTYVRKSETFVKWAEGVVRAIKKSLVRDKASGDYTGEDALSKIDAGQLTLIP